MNNKLATAQQERPVSPPFDAEAANCANYLSPKEAGEFLRCSANKLNQMRWKGTGPPYLKEGGRIVYFKPDLIRWRLAQRVVPRYSKVPQ